jgi:hypothetical protein
MTAAFGLRGAVVSCDSSGSADPWVAHIDVASGKTYYHNAEAQQRSTVWEKPAPAPVSEPPAATESPSTTMRVLHVGATVVGHLLLYSACLIGLVWVNIKK